MDLKASCSNYTHKLQDQPNRHHCDCPAFALPGSSLSVLSVL